MNTSASVLRLRTSERVPTASYPRRMYAIAFDMDTAVMEREYGSSNWRKGYPEVGDILLAHGFGHQQGSVYFGNESVTAVSCVLAAQDVARQLPWFAAAVRDIRMLRIEGNNDLSVALEAPVRLSSAA